MWENFIPLLSIPIGILSAYLAIKRYLKPELILDFSDILMQELTENVEMQKRVYLIGGLFGQGVKSGLGMTGKRGKFKIEDIITEGIGAFISGYIQKMNPAQEQQGVTPSPISKPNLNEPFK